MIKVKRPLVLSVTYVAPAILALFLASCYWNPQGGAGKITLNLTSTGRTQVNPGSVSYARVYLYADNMNSRVNIGDGTPYAETTMSPSGGSVTVNHVPAGSGYQIVLTLGTKPNGSTFVPGQFGESSNFDVTAGHETVVTIAGMYAIGTYPGTTGPLEYDSGLLGKNVSGVAVESVNSTIGATSGSLLYQGTSFPLSSAKGSLPPGVTPFSVSASSGQFLVNTNAGMYPFPAGSSYQLSGTVFGQSDAPAGQVAASTYYSFGQLNIGDTYYYQTPNGGLGGISNPASGGKWFTVEMKNGAAQPIVLDIGTGPYDGYAYLSTTAGAYVVSPELLSTGNNDMSYITRYGATLTATRNGKSLFISSVAIDGSGGAGNSDVYVATSSGVYVTAAGTGALDESTNVGSSAVGRPGKRVDIVADASAQLLPFSSGHPFARVVAQASSWAAVAVSNNFILFYDGSNTYPIPLAAITLGDINAIAISPSYIGAFVVIAGTEGLTYVPLSVPG